MGRNEGLITFSIVLICSSLALLKLYLQQQHLHFLYGTYVIINFYGVFGALNNVGEDSEWDLYGWLGKTEVFTTSVAFPCFVTQIWLKYEIIQLRAAWLHAILGVIPAVIFIFDNRLERKWIHAVVYICGVSSCVVCFLYANGTGIAATICFLVGFSIQRSNKSIWNASPEACFNLLTAVFTVLSLIAVLNEKPSRGIPVEFCSI